MKKKLSDEIVEQYSEKNWLINGLLFGLFLFILNTIILPYFYESELSYDWLILLEILLFSLLLGLVYGYMMKRFVIWKQSKTKNKC